MLSTKITRFIQKLAVISLLLQPLAAKAAEIKIAVASNFTDAINSIADRFTSRTGHKVVIVSGSTGKQYAQIKNGAPFDAFFAADAATPKLLEDEGLAVAGSRFTYAIGEIVLWSPKAGYVDSEGKILEKGGFTHIAIANPKLAPYGKAAQEVLENLGLWQKMQGQIVYGENISQALQFVEAGNAEMGFIAYSQIKRSPQSGSFWKIPRKLHNPIEQQAVLLNNNETAHAFLEFVKSGEALKIIADYGYGLPTRNIHKD